MSFRDNLQHLRATRNMTQEQLAMLLGVSRQSVTKWEAEKSYPEMDKLIKICQVFDCTLDELVQGDLTGREPDPATPKVPKGPAADICGYDEHMVRHARRVALGVGTVIMGVAGLLFVTMTLPALLGIPLEAGGPAESRFGAIGLVVLFAGVIGMLAFVVPSVMDDGAFRRAHPFVEDFYTEAERADTRRGLATAIVVGVALILAGVTLVALFDGSSSEDSSVFVLLALVAVAVALMTYRGMLYARVNIAAYNKDISEDLTAEEITHSTLDDAFKQRLLEELPHQKRKKEICSVIMLVATIVGLAWMFLASTAIRGYFWLSWAFGGIICGIVEVVMDGRRAGK